MLRPVDVVILCGGRGTRLQERTQEIPKPLVEIGGRPILWHIVRLYAEQGLRRFVLCTGYKGELIEQFVAREPWPEGIEVRCVATGLETPTGGRVLAVADHVGPRFCATYGDGLADIDLAAELAFHTRHGATATMAVVRPRLPFGITELGDGDTVTGFREKPRSEHWINGGFFVFERDVLASLGEESVLEREPLEDLATAGRLRAYRHTGFWGCMDTYKDAVALNDLWAAGVAPWKVWAD
jgi:glucose-1-phosphate cytidylyltransferase